MDTLTRGQKNKYGENLTFRCFDSPEAYLSGTSPGYGSSELIFKGQEFAAIVVIKNTFIDLQNQTQPYQTNYKQVEIKFDSDDQKYSEKEIYLSFNDVTFDDNTIGIFQQEAEIEHYLQFEQSVLSES